MADRRDVSDDVEPVKKETHMKDPVVEQAKRDAQVGAETPEHVTEKPGLHLSGGEINNDPARTKPYVERS